MLLAKDLQVLSLCSLSLLHHQRILLFHYPYHDQPNFFLKCDFCTYLLKGRKLNTLGASFDVTTIPRSTVVVGVSPELLKWRIEFNKDRSICISGCLFCWQTSICFILQFIDAFLFLRNLVRVHKKFQRTKYLQSKQVGIRKIYAFIFFFESAGWNYKLYYKIILCLGLTSREFGKCHVIFWWPRIINYTTKFSFVWVFIFFHLAI